MMTPLWLAMMTIIMLTFYHTLDLDLDLDLGIIYLVGGT